MSRITHVGVLVRDAEAALPQWSRLFGFNEIKRLTIPDEGVRSIFLSRDGGREGLLIELLQPLDPDHPDNVAAKRLRERGEGLFHLALVEDDITGARERLVEGKARFAACAPITDSGDDRLMVSPRDANGVMVEVISALEWSKIWASA